MKIIFTTIFVLIISACMSQPIFNNIINNDTLEIEKLVKDNSNLDIINSKYGTPLMAAVYLGKKSIIKLLIISGADINEEAGEWRGKVYGCVDDMYKGKSKKVGYSSAIDIAVESGNIDILKILINNGAILKPRLLLKSVKNNDLEILTFLIDKGILEEAKSEEISRSIVLAYLNDNLNITEYIIRNRSENQCLTYALIHFINVGNDDFIYYLNSNFEMHDYFNSEDFDDVIQAVLRKDNKVLMNFLRDQNVIINRKHKAGDYSLAVAENDNIEMFDFLLFQGLRFTDDKRITYDLFKYSAENNKVNTMRYFFEKNLNTHTDVNIMPESGGNYCNFTAMNDFSEICKVLIINGINPNLTDTAGYTSLDYALINENNDLIEFLNDHNALTSFNLTDKSRKESYSLFYDGRYLCDKTEALFFANVKYIDEKDCWKYFKFRKDGSLYLKGYYSDKNLSLKTDTFTYYFSDSSIYKIEVYDNYELKSKICPNHKCIEDSVIFVYVDDMPEFPGGQLALRKWIADNVKYPGIARESSIQGTVYLRFEVKKNGSIGKVELQKGVDPLMDQEAVKVIKNLPHFIPGYFKGIPVNVWYSIPVSFKLN